MTLLIVLLVLLLIGGGLGYSAPAYRGYVTGGVPAIIVVLLVLYVLHVI